MQEFRFTSHIRLWSNGTSPASRHFLTLPDDIAKDITFLQEKVEKKRGWGAVKVEVQVGYMKRKTSIFPDKKSGSYLLPIKKEIRRVLHIGDGDAVSVLLFLV